MRDKAARFNGGKVAAVYAWLRGDYIPDEAKRKAIEEAGGPLPHEWELPLAEAPASDPPPVVAVPGAATPGAIASEADAMLADIQAMRAHVSQLTGDPAEKIRNLERLTTMLVGLSKMRGVLMSERQILASPHWLAVEERMLAALTPWPDAMRAVADALDGVRTAA